MAVASLLDLERYALVWTTVPKNELMASAVSLKIPGGSSAGSLLVWKKLLMHKRRITDEMRNGTELAPFCNDCAACLCKAIPEMPVMAMANGRWLGRHPEIMRSMPYGHRLLLPVRRVILSRVVFTNNPKSAWERSHSQRGLNGVPKTQKTIGIPSF